MDHISPSQIDAAVLRAVRADRGTMWRIVGQVSEELKVKRSSVRDAVERLVESGKLQLGLSMYLRSTDGSR